jgi:putative hemolysin
MLDSLPHATLPTFLAEVALPIETPFAVTLFVVGLIGYAILNAAEIAVVGSSRVRIRAAAEEGRRSAQALERVKEHPETFFGVVVLLQNICVFLVSASGAVIAVRLFGNWGFLAGLIAVPLITTEFGEYTPKVIASRTAERFAFIVAIPIKFLMLIMRPLIAALAIVPNLLSKRGVTQTITEAELRMLIDIGAEEGSVTAAEAELLDRVFHFHDRRVNEVMIPRTEVVWLEHDATVRTFYETFDRTPHSRFPVYRETVDNVIGIVSIKDVLRALAEGKLTEASAIQQTIRPATFVPETKMVSTLFWEMQRERQQIAVVVDEYGGVAGIVTAEMLLEEMVGTLVDELGQTEEEFSAIDEHTTRVDGGMSIYDVREELGLALPEGEYETVAGYVLEQLGHIPREGETVTLDGYRITVTELKGVKIESVTVTKLPA